MRTEQSIWTRNGHWAANAPLPLAESAQLVLAFGAPSTLEDGTCFDAIRTAYRGAQVCGCSTAGEIAGTRVLDESLVVTAVQFHSAQLKLVSTRVSGQAESREAGRRLVQLLPPDGLVHVFVLSEGLKVNGSELVQGLVQNLPPGVAVTGGLSGDGARFERTLVTANQKAQSGVVAAIGFYGKQLRVGYGSMGGWDPFGPERRVTRSRGNVLYELDGCSALELYKTYLGEHAAELPGSALLFPLSVRTSESDVPVVRSVLSVDEGQQTLIFAGDVPEGAFARLMKANFDRLIDGAAQAAQSGAATLTSGSTELAVLISCVGRKIVLKQRIEEEVESVRDVLGPRAMLAGFYSYGEISPFTPSARCELHNQTMTITTFSEQ